MNNLEKLIKEYEREYPGRVAYEGEIDGNCDFYKNFVLWLASRPTCGVEQRKFLDEIREKGRSTTHNQHITISTDRGTYYELKQSDFKSNLKELVNE